MDDSAQGLGYLRVKELKPLLHGIPKDEGGKIVDTSFQTLSNTS
jgi:hypothetical protein